MDDKLTAPDILTEHRAKIIECKISGLSVRKAAEILSEYTGKTVTYNSMRTCYERVDQGMEEAQYFSSWEQVQEITDDDEEIPITELIRQRIKANKRKQVKSSRHRRILEMPPEPFGIFVIGDPHIDNDGCDMKQLSYHVDLVSKYDGVYAACVGDIQDNWIGRLARLYANASVTASDGWRLSEWLLSSLNYICIVGGNHDAWAHGPGVDPLAWLSRRTQVMCYAPDELRITFRFKGRPDLEELIWVCRHDFKGRSFYHPTHGVHKEAMLDGKCHLLTAGHLHQWGQLSTEQRHKRITHAVRVRGYKKVDRYAMEKGFPSQDFGASCLIAIQPEITGPGRIQIFWNVEQGLDFVAWLRDKKKA